MPPREDRGQAYEWIVRLATLLLRIFFRRIEVTGLAHIPKEGGGVLVSWHPNGMIDPGLLFSTFPRRVIFGARHGLFKWPVLGWLMRAAGAVPIYRAVDSKGLSQEARRAANQESLDALAEAVAAGGFSALFPEGDSHDAPHLIELKTGAARFYYRARQLAEGPAAGAGSQEARRPPVILPVGLHYDKKRLFRSSVLVAFHPPMQLPEALDVTPTEGEAPEEVRERQRALTAAIERELHQAVHATESWEVHHLMHRASKLIRAERAHRAGSDLAAPTMEERTRAAHRIWAGYQIRKDSHPEEVAVLRERVAEYDRDLRALGMEDHELDRGPRLIRLWMALVLVMQVILVYLLLPPILLVGYLVNGPPAVLLWLINRLAARRKKDEATVKVLVGAVLFPSTWILAGVLAGWGHSVVHDLYPAIPDTFVLAGFFVGLLGMVGGVVAVLYLGMAQATARAVRVRLTRHRRTMAIVRLKADRAELHDALTGLVSDLDLPGSVAPDGTVRHTIPGFMP